MENRDKEFIWYCPRTRCNAILLKTSKPYLPDLVIRCKRCGETLGTNRIIAGNKKNMQKFLNELASERE